MKKFQRLFVIILSCTLLFSLTGCRKTESGSTTKETTAASRESTASETAGNPEEASAKAVTDPEESGKEATGEFKLLDSAGAAIEPENSVYTITSAGEYTLSGALNNGQVIVDAGDGDEVILILKNASLSCSTGAAILGLNAGELTVRSEEGSYNTVTDTRTGSDASEEDAEEDGSVLNDDAAIYSKCDLKITGKGTLIVNSTYDNGIKSTKDLSVKNVTLKVTSEGVCLKGNDSAEIKSGVIMLISNSADGIKTRDSDISSKGNQRGTILIEGGTLEIHSAQDAISAAYNFEMTPADGENPSVSIYTASYSELDNSEAAGEWYLVVPSELYDEGNDYYIYFYDDDDTAGTYVRAEYDTMIYGGSTAYYGLIVKAPARANMLVNIVDAGTVPDGSNYSAATEGDSCNSSMNGYFLSDISDGVISGDWVTISYGGSDNSDKTTWSSKGIKAGNEIIINGGTLQVYADDDGLHANGGDTLGNGETSLGNVTINDGSVRITSADDGIHADEVLTVNGGTVDVTESHEGLEGNVINIIGGDITVYGKDDGLNAGSGNETPAINITGGNLDVTTPSGDTDAIDSNGNITMSGGTVLVKGGAQMGGVAGSIDLDGSFTVTGGTLAAFGGICSIPSGSSVNTYVSGGTSFAAGSYSLLDASGKELFSFDLPGSYSACFISSSLLQTGESYTLNADGAEILSWTQSAQTEGSASYGMQGGKGGFGGRGGRR